MRNKLGKGSTKVRNLKRVLDTFPYLLALALTLSFLGSCKQPGGSPGDPGPTVQTIKWQLDGSGSVQFSTNDTANYNYGFWMPYTQENEATMTTDTVTATKMSGSLGEAYGMTFCYQDNSNFYDLLISASGSYEVFKCVSGTYTSIKAWTASANLSSGAGVANVISVKYNGGNSFSVYLNNLTTQVLGFTDSSFTGGKAGFKVIIGTASYENFPGTAEDVRFKMSSPVAYP